MPLQGRDAMWGIEANSSNTTRSSGLNREAERKKGQTSKPTLCINKPLFLPVAVADRPSGKCPSTHRPADAGQREARTRLVFSLATILTVLEHSSALSS